MSEIGTAWVSGITTPAAGHRSYVAEMAGVEVISALARRARGGSLSATDAAAAIARFRHHFAQQYRVVRISSALLTQAMTLAETHALRGYDAVQLAAALQIHARRLSLRMAPLTLVSADLELNSAASAEGLAVDDPTSHP